MDKYSGYPKELRVPFLEKEKLELKLFIDSVMTYVKNGVGCSQTTGHFYQLSLVENLSFVTQQRLVYQIQAFLADEAKLSMPKLLASFFTEKPTGCVERADEILSHCDPKTIPQKHL